MQYLTGLLAFGVECERDSVGLWNLTKDQFVDSELYQLKNSEESPFKDYGIEVDKIVPYHEYCVVNVADHVRAYCDLLYEGRFDLLKDLFEDSIRSLKCRKDIFMLVYGKLKYLAEFHEINEFMTEEFGNAWISYIESVHSVAEHISNRADAIEQLEKIQNGEVNITNPLYDTGKAPRMGTAPYSK